MSYTDEELLEFINSAVVEIKEHSNPEELNRLKKLVRKNVPFTMRGYLTAYLIDKKLTKHSFKKERPAKKVVELPANSETLYINLGKFGHMYAKELVNYITTNSGLQKEDVLKLKVLDKYSFVTMSNENCQIAINKLNGLDLRGRKVQVNIANKETKKD